MIDLSNPKHRHCKQHGIKATNPSLPLILRPPPTDTVVASNHNSTSLAPTTITETSNDLDLVAKEVVQRQWPSLGSHDTRSTSPDCKRGRVLLALLRRPILAYLLVLAPSLLHPSTAAGVFQLGVSTFNHGLIFFSSSIHSLIICSSSLGLICWTRLCWLMCSGGLGFFFFLLVLVWICCCLVFGIVWCWFFDRWVVVGVAD